MRRISTKLVVAVVATVILPFVALTLFIEEQIADRLTRHVVQQSLLGLAKDLAGQIDSFVQERRTDVEGWAEAPLTNDALNDYLVERSLLRRVRSGETDTEVAPWGARLAQRTSDGQLTFAERRNEHWSRSGRMLEFDRVLELKPAYDLILLLAEDGRLITSSSRAPDGSVFPPTFLEELYDHDYSSEPWFEGALSGRMEVVDQHVSPFRFQTVGSEGDMAWNYHLGFAAPVREPGPETEVRGVLYALVNWRFVQDLVSSPVVKDAFRGLVEPGEDPSPYAWIWARDADTILGHVDRSLYRQSITDDLGLPSMTQAVRESASGWGLYPEYSYNERKKNAAFRRTAMPSVGGFGWVVGVGIDNDDIYATADELSRLLLGGTAIVLLVAVTWTFVIARRTTRPILELQRSTRRVAQGDLDAQIDIRSKDELGALASDFNRMTRELKTQREQLVKAEKAAAWQEMARQIAHDIKNPLTPIKLSLDLLERVRREGSPGSDEILERTMTLMNRQVEHLRVIAGDFYEFTGGRKPKPESFDLGELLDEVLHLHDAWAVELGVEVQRDGEPVQAFGDRSKLQRVFVNLVSNALQAMTDGGQLFLETRNRDGVVEVSIRDTGPGLSEEARGRLFEPYFTTKSEGTGLGLAISHRVVEESGGTITLESVPPAEGTGTLAVVRLPAGRPAGGAASGGAGPEA